MLIDCARLNAIKNAQVLTRLTLSSVFFYSIPKWRFLLWEFQEAYGNEMMQLGDGAPWAVVILLVFLFSSILFPFLFYTKELRASL